MTDLFKWLFGKTEKKNPSNQPLNCNWFHPTEPCRCVLTLQSTFSHIQSKCPVYDYPLLECGLPCDSAGKESTCNVGDVGLIPGLGRSPGEGKCYPLQYSGLENSMDFIHGVPKSWIRLRDFHSTWMCYWNVGGTQEETNNRWLQFVESLRLKGPNLWGHLICIPENQAPGEHHPSAHAAQLWHQGVPRLFFILFNDYIIFFSVNTVTLYFLKINLFFKIYWLYFIFLIFKI